jgi:hypothetical protein
MDEIRMTPRTERRRILLRRIRVLLAVFIVGLVLSGATAIPLEWEVGVLARLLGLPPDANPQDNCGLAHWIAAVQGGLHETFARYPFIAYGTDWLAFGHFIMAILFLGALRDPVRNLWVLTFGMIACVLVIPVALVFGPVRGIPFYWQLIDCSFGVFGIIPVWLSRRWAAEVAALGAEA